MWRRGLLALFCLAGIEARSLTTRGTDQVQAPAVLEESGFQVPDIITRMFKGSHDQNIDRVVLESMDSRVDLPALQTVVETVRKELEAKSQEQFDMYHKCLMLPKGESLPVEKCMDGETFKGGRLLTSVALQGLHEAGHYGAYESVRYIIRQMTQGDGFKFSKLRDLRLKEAEAFSNGEGASLLSSGPHLQLEVLCRDCLQDTLRKLDELGEHPDQEQVNDLAADVDKWAIALRCAASSGFPDCLPVSVYKVYKCAQNKQEPGSADDPDCREVVDLEEVPERGGEGGCLMKTTQVKSFGDIERYRKSKEERKAEINKPKPLPAPGTSFRHAVEPKKSKEERKAISAKDKGLNNPNRTLLREAAPLPKSKASDKCGSDRDGDKCDSDCYRRVVLKKGAEPTEEPWYFTPEDVQCHKGFALAQEAIPDYLQVLPAFVQPAYHPFKKGPKNKFWGCTGEMVDSCGKEIAFSKFKEAILAKWKEVAALGAQNEQDGRNQPWNIKDADKEALLNILWRALVFQHNTLTVQPSPEIENRPDNKAPDNKCWDLVMDKLKDLAKQDLDADWLTGGNNCGFWTGGIGVSMYGRSIGVNMLEETKVGRMFDILNEVWGGCEKDIPSPWLYGGLWNAFSSKFAKTCTGVVTIFMKARDDASVLYRKEWPQLFTKYQQKEGTEGKIDDITFVHLVGATGEIRTAQEAAQDMMVISKFSLSTMKEVASRKLEICPEIDDVLCSYLTYILGDEDEDVQISFIFGDERNRIGSSQDWTLEQEEKENLIRTCKELTNGDELYLLYKDKISKENNKMFGNRSSQTDNWAEKILRGKFKEDKNSNNSNIKKYVLDESQLAFNPVHTARLRLPPEIIERQDYYYLDLAQGLFTINYKKIYYMCMCEDFPRDLRVTKPHRTDNFKLSNKWRSAQLTTSFPCSSDSGKPNPENCTQPKEGESPMILHQVTFKNDLEKLNAATSPFNPLLRVGKNGKSLLAKAVKRAQTNSQWDRLMGLCERIKADKFSLGSANKNQPSLATGDDAEQMCQNQCDNYFEEGLCARKDLQKGADTCERFCACKWDLRTRACTEKGSP